MEKTVNVPTAQEASNIVTTFITKIAPLRNAKTKIVAKNFLCIFFSSDKLDYAFEKWWQKRKEGGVGDWFLQLDCWYTQQIIESIFVGVDYPKLEISNHLKRFCNGEFSEGKLQAMERAWRPRDYGKGYPTEEIIVQKFCLWTLNRCEIKKMASWGKQYDCINWGWADWFINATEEQKIEFCEKLIHYR